MNLHDKSAILKNTVWQEGIKEGSFHGEPIVMVVVARRRKESSDARDDVVSFSFHLCTTVPIAAFLGVVVLVADHSSRVTMAPTTTGTVLTSGTVSYTAPQFTEEDLKRERESLSVEEREEIDAEVRGTRAILRETPKLIERGLIGMQRTLNEIPDHEKEGYLKALERCPDLVRTETDSLIFLRAERFDPIAAARRLVKNWDVRCKLFGDRSFLPMDLSGGDTGALTDDDLDALQRGVCLCAPEDSMGRVALILNRGRIHQDEAIVSKNLGPFNVSVPSFCLNAYKGRTVHILHTRHALLSRQGASFTWRTSLLRMRWHKNMALSLSSIPRYGVLYEIEAS